MGKEWIKIKELGQLYLEKVLVAFDIPILFVCVDFVDRKYLCLNTDAESGKTVIAPTDNQTLIDMLNNDITMESVFRNAIDGKVIVADYDIDNNEIIVQTEDSQKITGELLPKKNEYLDLSNKSIEQYILSLRRQLITLSIGSFWEKKKIIVQQSVCLNNFEVKNVNKKVCNKVLLTETNKICSYKIVDNSRMIA